MMRNHFLKTPAAFLAFFILSASCFETFVPSKMDKLFSPQFDIECTSTTIQLRNFTAPSNTAYKFLLQDRELIGIDEAQIAKKIMESSDTLMTRSLTLSRDKKAYTTFFDLISGHTYYLYFVEINESDKRLSGPYLKIVKTDIGLSLSLNIMKEYATNWLSLLTPIILLAFSAFCIGKIEKRNLKPKNDGAEGLFHEKMKAEQSFRKHELKLREHANVHQESSLSIKSNVREKINLSSWQERNEIERTIRRLEEDNKEFEDRLICEICCERFREVIFLSCGHVYCCEKCAMELVTCPIDKSVIGSKYRYNMCDKYGINNQLLPQIIASRLQHLDILRSNEGCSSLIRRDGPLIEKYLMLKLKNDNYKMFYNCIICNERKKNVLFLHCRHLICCDRCAENLKICPLDQLQIIKKTHVFTA